jgi:lysophospholipid acyltransferase (LPLAT)-like uncharacterized protein
MLRAIIALYIEVSAFLLWAAIVLVNRTLRITPINLRLLEEFSAKHQKIIFVFWHRTTFVPLYQYRGKKTCILTAKSLRGEILTRVARRLGYTVIRISEDEKAADRVRSLMQVLSAIKEGSDVCIAVDGPSGPVFKMKPGSLFLAGKSQCPIIPMVVVAPRAWVFNRRWDKYFVPWPFARVWIGFGDPIKIKPDASSEEIKNYCDRIETALLDLTRKIEEEAKVY